MDIRRLEAFCKVYECGGFSKAGQELFLSQPTISSHVLALEQELGAQLFDRLGRSIQPTMAGEILYKHAKKVFASLSDAEAEVRLLQEKVGGELHVGGSTVPAAYLLPRMVASFWTRFPDVHIRLDVGDSQEIIAAVHAGDLAMGVVGATQEGSDLEFLPLLRDDLVVAASPRMRGLERFAAGETPVIGAQELARWPWVLREHGSGTRKALETALAALDLDIRHLDVIVEAHNAEAVIQCALAGLGLCVTSRLAAAQLIERGDLVPLAVQGLVMTRSFFQVRNVRRHVFPALRFFLEHVARMYLEPPREG